MADDFEVHTTRHVRGAIQGDPESLNWLVERFSPLLRAQAEYRLGRALASRISPDDVVQEAWLAVLPRLGEIVARGGRYTPVLLSYLSKTVCGRAIDHLRVHLRQSSRERSLPPSSPSTAGGPGMDSLAALVRSSSSEARTSEFARSLSQALQSLSAQEREVVVLRLIEGRDNAEAATELGERPNSVAQRYRRALLKLRTCLPDIFSEEFV